MTKKISLSNLQYIESEIIKIIADKRKISNMKSFYIFSNSEIYKALLDDDMKLWHFSPLAIYDMWEHEVRTGDFRNSLYLRGDELE